VAFTSGARISPRPSAVKASKPPRRGIQYHIPLIGDIHDKSPMAYRATRGAVGVANVAQMAFAEAYINGVELPDPVLRSLFNACMPSIFKYVPALLTPYEWVL
jgi:cyclopropane-fatty-acyl-phospholipid synthase